MVVPVTEKGNTRKLVDFKKERSRFWFWHVGLEEPENDSRVDMCSS